MTEIKDIPKLEDICSKTFMVNLTNHRVIRFSAHYAPEVEYETLVREMLYERSIDTKTFENTELDEARVNMKCVKIMATTFEFCPMQSGLILTHNELALISSTYTRIEKSLLSIEKNVLLPVLMSQLTDTERDEMLNEIIERIEKSHV